MSKSRRRAKGTGSVYTRKDGRAVGEYEVNGKTKYIYGRDEDTVREEVAEASTVARIRPRHIHHTYYSWGYLSSPPFLPSPSGSEK